MSEHLEDKDPTGARIGMWLFLLTELILFGGLFLIYAVYRSQFPAEFHFSAGHLNSAMGTVNTLVLLTSSLTVVLGIHAIGQGKRELCAFYLGSTVVAGFVFLVIKYFEWSAKFHHGLYPGSAELLKRTPGENLFFALYFAMTGLHGIHVIVGMAVISVMIWFVLREPAKTVLPADHLEILHVRVENSGLYWHLVDVIWIFLFPLFYLIS